MPDEVKADAAASETPDFAAIDAVFEKAYGSQAEPTAAEILGGPDDTATDETKTPSEIDPTPLDETGEAAAPGETAPEGTPTEESTTIDPSLMALAVSEGVDPAKMDELIAEDPVRANELLTKLAEEVNSTTLQTLQTQQRSTEHAESPDAATPSEDKPVSPLEALLTDTEALAVAKEEHGETYVEKYLVPLAEQAKAFREDREFMAQAREEMEVQKEQALVTQLNATFKNFGVGYENLYGKDVSAANEEQVASRQQVAGIADQLRVSDIASGKPEKPIDFYITRGHHVVSASHTKEAARKELISQIQTRSKSTTARPSRSKTKLSGDSDDAAGEVFDRKLNELGIEDYFRD